jgi:hypothetical protein
MSHLVWYTIRMKMINEMKNKIRTYRVEFTTAFAGSSHIEILLEAKDENQANWVARNLCRFGYISNTEVTTNRPDYTEKTHEWAYDEDYEVYS